MSTEQNRHQPGSEPAPVLVLGVGNILLRDEGVGVRVVEAMAGLPLPAGVELLDGGTAAIDLLDVIADRQKLIVVDAVQAGETPGAVFRFSPDDLLRERVEKASLHQIEFVEVLDMAIHLGCVPKEVVIFGIQPKDLDWGLELSPEVAGVVSKVVEMVMAELGCLKGSSEG